MSGVLSTPSRSRSPPARSRSPAPRRLRPTKYYVCRAPEYLVGAGHGIHDSWDDIKKYLHRPASDVVRAAVAPNHKSFPRTAGGLEHAQAYLESPPELFLSGIQINAVGRVCLVFVGTIAIFYAINVATSYLMEMRGCAYDYVRLKIECNCLKEVDVFITRHMGTVYHAFGVAAVGLFSCLVQQVLTFINGGGRL